ncbi:hypothetical protein FRC04_009857 [Tulasnella sp. 424]|nr:hypothetical protein FRC04_009857 [Tulasnella sp. 424]
MSDLTPEQLTESPKSPPMLPEEKETPRAPKRVKLCLRAVLEALSNWRVDVKDLVFSDEGAQKRGGSADVAKATASIVEPLGPGDQSSTATHDVAVKKFRLSGGDLNKRGQAAVFANELSLLSELHHDNIVELTGFAESAEEDIAWILLRWEDNGNLREFIHSQDWVIPERLELLNILVNSQNDAVITDFGSARKLESYPRGEKENNIAGPAARDEDTVSQFQEQGTSLVQIEECGTFLTLTGPVYTLRWAAPEVLRDEEFGLASDMWAFAWICWEIMTGSLPFNDLCKETDIILNVARGNLPPVTSNEHISQVRVLCVMMSRCWRMEPASRPAAKDCESSISFMDRLAPTRRRLTGELKSYSAEVLSALGYIKYENLQNKEAKDYFVMALKVAESAGDAMAAARARVGQGTVCHRLGEYAEAEALYTAAREISERLGAKSDMADAMWGLGELYRSWNEYSRAEAFYNEAKEIYASLGDEKKVADATWGLGGTYRSWNEYPKAETSYTEAKEIYARLGDEKYVADAIWGLGDVYSARNEYYKAEASYTEAKEIYVRLGVERSVADAIWGLGEVYLSRDEYCKAETSYAEAREIYARLVDEKSVADAIWGLGEVYRFRNEYSKAETSYTEAKEIYVRLGAETGVANATWGLGEIYWGRNEYSKAETSYTEVKEIYARLGADRNVADATLGLGEVYQLRKEYSKAKAAFIEAREIYIKTGYQEGVEDAISYIADLSEEEGWRTGVEDSLSETSTEAEDEA